MQQCVAPSTSLLFLLLCCCCCCCNCFFLPKASLGRGRPETYLTKPTSSRDIVNQTCEKCYELSQTLSYAFCWAALGPIPIAHMTNVEGLAVISMELALQNATNTVSTITELLKDMSLDPFTTLSLKRCLELYGGTVPILVDSIGAFMMGQYGTSAMWLSGVMETASNCEDGFGKRTSEASPLSQENWRLFQLSDIAICIIHLLSFPSATTPS
ncbi:hypothetical protein SAY87_000031 [Trapa incisa]|uniref:Pectinesterase inhibitor domain-containing protein n=1 Tax=Trapa incisa TaxID=236973 RepID=A0AAN7JGN4_9MYRT|nr:hypothetical protein SAY87_000031 [Trapa incisa]